MLKRIVRRAAKIGRRVRSRFVEGGLILMYHRVVDPGTQPLRDPFQICVSPQNFAGHLEAIAKVGNPIPLVELTRRAQRGERLGHSIALTFDDGYLDNVTVAGPLLRSRSIPATFFVVAGALGQGFWWDHLARAVDALERLPDRLEVERDGRRLAWRTEVDDPSARRRFLAALHPLMKDGPQASRRALAEQVGLSWNETPHEPTARAADEQELTTFAQDPLFEIGAHTWSHPALSALSAADQRVELQRSRDRLQELTGTAVTSFAYPFGGPGDFTTETVDLVDDTGFERACATTPDVVSAASHPLRLPRIWVEDWTGEELIRQMRRWMRLKG